MSCNAFIYDYRKQEYFCILLVDFDSICHNEETVSNLIYSSLMHKELFFSVIFVKMAEYAPQFR